tara:strand:- start:13072 stop:13338 length:267 start_codon:yes stop_codon:yes gene_type:complete
MKKKVRVYGFEGCQYCDELIGYYNDNWVQFDYIDINDKKNKKEVDIVMELGQTESVPVILVNKMVLSPENSFKTIKEAYLLTMKLLTQ